MSSLPALIRILLEVGAWLTLVILLVLRAGDARDFLLLPWCAAVLVGGRIGSALAFAFDSAGRSALAATLVGGIAGTVAYAASMFIELGSPMWATWFLANSPGAMGGVILFLILAPFAGVLGGIGALIVNERSRRGRTVPNLRN
jgi:hypothetical protein